MEMVEIFVGYFFDQCSVKNTWLLFQNLFDPILLRDISVKVS